MLLIRAEGEGAPFAERDEEHSHLLRDGCRPLPRFAIQRGRARHSKLSLTKLSLAQGEHSKLSLTRTLTPGGAGAFRVYFFSPALWLALSFSHSLSLSIPLSHTQSLSLYREPPAA